MPSLTLLLHLALTLGEAVMIIVDIVNAFPRRQARTCRNLQRASFFYHKQSSWQRLSGRQAQSRLST